MKKKPRGKKAEWKVDRHLFTVLFVLQLRGVRYPLPLLAAASPTSPAVSFRAAKKDRSKVTFSLARRRADAQSFWLALSRLQTEHSKSAVLALSPGMGNLTTALHLQSIMRGFSKIHPVWQFQSPELHKGVSSLHSDLCVNGITYWIIAAYLFPNRITMKEEKSAGVVLLYLRKHFKTYYFE